MSTQGATIVDVDGGPRLKEAPHTDTLTQTSAPPQGLGLNQAEPTSVDNTEGMPEGSPKTSEAVPLLKGPGEGPQHDGTYKMNGDPMSEGAALEHSESLESRDNPFLPGGDLSREAEDLLSKATIIRDNFYLKEDEKQALLSQHQGQGRTDDLPKDANDSRAVAVEERVTQQLASPVSSAPPPASSPRLNGKAGETRENATDDAIPQAKNSPLAGGLNVHDAEKKRGNKCCSLM